MGRYALNSFIKKEMDTVYVVPDHQRISLPGGLTSLLLVCGVRGQPEVVPVQLDGLFAFVYF